MQTTFFSTLFARRPARQTEVTQQAASAPVELQAAELEQVAGGLTTKGSTGPTLASFTTGDPSEGPNGCW